MTLWTRLHLDDITKVLALCGGVLYGLQFIAYRAYYDALDLSPEDVGVDAAYILVRAPGAIMLMFAGTIPVVLSRLARPDAASEAGKKAAALHSYLLSALLGVIVGVSFIVSPFYGSDRVSPSLGLACSLVGGLVVMRMGLRADVPIRILEVCVAALMVLTLMSFIFIGAAGPKGQRAADGVLVNPIAFAGLVIVDVSSTPVTILWSDPKTPYPNYFGTGASPMPAKGSLIGQTSNSIIVTIASGEKHKVVRFDPRQVIIEFGG